LTWDSDSNRLDINSGFIGDRSIVRKRSTPFG
jgi:hypothetical protein